MALHVFCSCFFTTDSDSNLVAIKKIIKAFEHRVFSLRTYRELKIQRLLDHENILGIKRILLPKDKKIFNENGIIPDDILSSNQLYYSEEACRNKVNDTMVMIGNEDFIPGQEILGKVAQMILAFF